MWLISACGFLIRMQAKRKKAGTDYEYFADIFGMQSSCKTCRFVSKLSAAS
jgi:hypothetical protein